VIGGCHLSGSLRFTDRRSVGNAPYSLADAARIAISSRREWIPSLV
jgi:hypothetical protein